MLGCFFFLSLSVPYLLNRVYKETLGDNVLGRGSNVVVERSLVILVYFLLYIGGLGLYILQKEPRL